MVPQVIPTYRQNVKLFLCVWQLDWTLPFMITSFRPLFAINRMVSIFKVDKSPVTARILKYHDFSVLTSGSGPKIGP